MSDFYSQYRVDTRASRVVGPFVMGFFSLCIAGCETTTQTANEVASAAAVPVAQTQDLGGQVIQPAQTIPTAPDREAILDTIDMFFEALATGDDRSIDILVSQEAISVTAFPEELGRPVRYGMTRDVADSMRAGDFPKIEEPYWDPIILQRKNLAVVWAPYEVWVNERLSHCGIDVFNLTRQKTSWRIDGVHWTQEPSACEELWPEGRSILRPGMFTAPE